MATAWKTLGQSNPSATTLADLYTVPAATQVVCRLTVCNRSSTPTSFRWSVALNGAADSNEQYRDYDRPIGANDSWTSPPFAIDATDKVRVWATLATLSFNLDGVEKT